TSRPYHVWRQRSAALRRVIREAAGRRRYDLALATMTHLFPFIENLGPDVRLVVDTHNIDSLVLSRYAGRMRIPRRWYAQMTAARLRRHERHVFARADRIVVCSDIEAPFVRRVPGSGEPAVIPNGVDASGTFVPGTARPVPGRIAFFGKLDYYPNADAVEYLAEAILPRIRAELPEAEAHVIGPDPPPAVRALERPGSGIRVTGRVPEIPAALSTASVVVVPLRLGGGTRLKILEALALGLPVVSTSIGAEGLDLEPGRDLVVADDPGVFAAEVIGLLRDPERGRRLGANGRETVSRRFDWSVIEGRIDALLTIPESHRA
ncbi:MAG: glycosyltransferase family 4 protein, partial [Gemmatimonadota bacterium]